ncbi:hypothetical protein XAP412_1100008 [Xanthomonas phaseoli pv. phaseoli]|uniref:Uncharacterized protein n=1 Tax=Xanthomonas campestris pv. phaseoli TaxID=317013 RepID=A0AB38DUU4_XANCH|nr:hypothetical protein XAP412_1100008 [Xanthomonas phaseoli pv. phaseoli]SON76252.1 hypothetical protein XAP6984_1150008 [Xanthomonas phaseoli pv. phaseoli]SON79797.1 hypothetical protein XAP7430_1120008 [Xanthomonas phaseoli pv. phaseoli]SOO30746.1 hypothetical protein XAP6164_4710003 [Xanthomonas phaseoli pv. phaseoli]
MWTATAESQGGDSSGQQQEWCEQWE